MWVCAECPTRAHHLMDQPRSRLCTPSAGMDAQWARSAGGAVLGLLRAVGSNRAPPVRACKGLKAVTKPVTLGGA